MGLARDNFETIVKGMKGNAKVEQAFTTNIAGKDVNWDMKFQFNLDNEDPFYLEIEDRIAKIVSGTASDAPIIMSGDNNAIVRICEGKGDFTHAISREQITVEKGKVMEVIRLTRAIAIVLKSS